MSAGKRRPSPGHLTKAPALVRLLDGSLVRRFKLARALTEFGYDVIEGDHDPVSLIGDGRCDLLLIEADQAPGALWPVEDLCQIARAHWRDCVIVQLAGEEDWSKERCRLSGITAALSKPVTTDALHACLQALLSTPEPLAPLLDMGILIDLERLGGRAFVAELVEQFAIECEALPQALELAAKARDDYAFCALLHALRSAAGNLGASRVFARCLAWRELSAMELAQDGDCRVAILRDDLAQTIIALRALPG